jgi:precorrin-2 dehydrogenase/sirohydrochlorin ferrochelatase
MFVPMYPVNLNLLGRSCAVIGGGLVAERKVVSLLHAKAIVTIFSPQLTKRLSQLAERQLLSAYLRRYNPGDLTGYFLVICATNDSIINRQAAMEAKAAQALVNVVDVPELCDFTVPAQVVRGDLLLTVSTAGHSPKFARLIRQQLEKKYGEEYGIYLDLLGEIRSGMKQQLSAKQRQCFWQETLDGEILDLLAAGKLKEAEDRIRYATCSIGIES